MGNSPEHIPFLSGCANTSRASLSRVLCWGGLGGSPTLPEISTRRCCTVWWAWKQIPGRCEDFVRSKLSTEWKSFCVSYKITVELRAPVTVIKIPYQEQACLSWKKSVSFLLDGVRVSHVLSPFLCWFPRILVLVLNLRLKHGLCLSIWYILFIFSSTFEHFKFLL